MIGSEDDFIAALRAIATEPGARGLSDDAAELKLSNTTLVVTHDTMVEGVHWLSAQDAADVAWKLVAVNLSDLAAKGATPVAILLGYMLADPDWNARFAVGLREAVDHFVVPLLGGDTVADPARSARAIGLTAIGRPSVVPSPARADARPGQALWVTGELGGALAGFEILSAGGSDPEATRAYRRPTPLLDDGKALAPLVGAMMDVSDGLLLDAQRMAQASGTTITIDSAAVPVVAALADRRDDAMRWGDDYQLLFTLPEGTPCPVPATRIGSVMARGNALLLVDGVPASQDRPLGYRHGD